MVTCGGLVTQSRGAGTRRAEPAGGEGPGPRARRRDGTYLPGFGSGSAGHGAAGALPPSFLLPPTPAPQRDTQYSPEAEAAPRGSCQCKPGCRRAAAGGPSGACGRRRREASGENLQEESRARRDLEG